MRELDGRDVHHRRDLERVLILNTVFLSLIAGRAVDLALQHARLTLVQRKRSAALDRPLSRLVRFSLVLALGGTKPFWFARLDKLSRLCYPIDA